MAKIKVKITGAVSASPFLLTHHIGDEVDIEKKLAESLIEAGVAEYANAQKAVASKCAKDIEKAVAEYKQDILKKDEAIEKLQAKVTELTAHNESKDAEINELKTEVLALGEKLEDTKTAKPVKKEVNQPMAKPIANS